MDDHRGPIELRVQPERRVHAWRRSRPMVVDAARRSRQPSSRIQNGSSRLLISQDFLPKSDPTRRPRGTLRNKSFSAACDPTGHYGHTTVFSRSVLPARAAFPEQVSPPAMLALADDAALARLAIAATQRLARLPPRSFPIARPRACPCGLERSRNA